MGTPPTRPLRISNLQSPPSEITVREVSELVRGVAGRELRRELREFIGGTSPEELRGHAAKLYSLLHGGDAIVPSQVSTVENAVVVCRAHGVHIGPISINGGERLRLDLRGPQVPSTAGRPGTVVEMATFP